MGLRTDHSHQTLNSSISFTELFVASLHFWDLCHHHHYHHYHYYHHPKKSPPRCPPSTASPRPLPTDSSRVQLRPTHSRPLLQHSRRVTHMPCMLPLARPQVAVPPHLRSLRSPIKEYLRSCCQGSDCEPYGSPSFDRFAPGVFIHLALERHQVIPLPTDSYFSMYP